MNKIGAILIGGTGYGAKEFLRLSLNHPELEVVEICSKSESSKYISDLHREFKNILDSRFSQTPSLDLLTPFTHKFIVLALPHGESQLFVKDHFINCKENGIHILDLSGDFRITDTEKRETWYPNQHNLSEEIYKSFTYGLSEINKDQIKSAQNICNPGCFSTGAILSLYPLIKNYPDLIINIAIDGKSGSSGGGKSPKQTFHHPELNSSAYAYNVLKHRHEAEITDALGVEENKLAFVPHVIPLSRGMLISAYIFTKDKIKQDDLTNLYISTYKQSKFVRILSNPPEIRLVAGSNFIDIYPVVRDNVISITVAFDNLVKGMAGQAIQNINILSELKEDTGLKLAPLGLV